MTTTALRGPEAAAGAAQRTEAAPRRARPRVLPAFCALVTALGLLLIGFFGYFYGLSGLSEARAQDVRYKTFAGQLGAAVAPIGPAPDGAPVAILAVPALGISGLVVGEGATSADLTQGPGLVSSSVLPGQAGVSVVDGRAAAFGAPFARLMDLSRGDRITVTTGQGVSTYTVESFGASGHRAPDPTPNRLVLQTADSSVFAHGYVQVTADLVGAPKPAADQPPAAGPREAPLAGDGASVLPLVLWAEALAALAAAGWWAARRWSRAAAYLCVLPAALALLWAVYENAAVLLPNLY